jgi:hypothetical protein
MKGKIYLVGRAAFRSINRLLKGFGLVLSKPDFVHGSPAFSGALVLSRRMFQTKGLLESLEQVEGDVVEGGVHWGYGLIIELLLTNKKIHAFDSFKGHSSATVSDLKSENWKPLDKSFAVSKDDAIKTVLLGTNLTLEEINSRIIFYEGWVKDTMPAWAEQMLTSGRKIAYVHADMDIYEPVKEILIRTYPLLAKGAIVSVGRLHNPELAGKTKAFKDFIGLIDQSGIDIKKTVIIDTNGSEQEHTYFIKR